MPGAVTYFLIAVGHKGNHLVKLIQVLIRTSYRDMGESPGGGMRVEEVAFCGISELNSPEKFQACKNCNLDGQVPILEQCSSSPTWLQDMRMREKQENPQVINMCL